MKRPTILLLAALALGAAHPAAAQSPQPGPDRPVDAATRTAVIDALASALNEQYIFADKAREMEASIRQRARRGEYDALTGSRAFADSLTAHLQAVSHDRHLRVRFSPEPIPQRRGAPPSPEEIARYRDEARIGNHGFEKVERLPGNVGYLEMRGFAGPEAAGETAAAAMTFLAGTDALIIDLRRNGGGSPGMVALVSSYLFDEPTHLNSLYWRVGDRTEQFWTLPYVPGRRFGSDKPVYILTSDRTFSAAEEFTYNLQNLKRATVVGDTTGGGAHPGGTVRLHEHFGVFVPRGRAVSPITGTNWEGTGIRPDVPVPTDHALQTAYVDALAKVIATLPEGERKQGLTETLGNERRKLEEMRGFAGPEAAG
ncbi:MAG TPA: S41 family peptidase, partial [Longimicrobium sp.]|nr:S41 family peptidase [Longimicrobium sp.]